MRFRGGRIELHISRIHNFRAMDEITIEIVAALSFSLLGIFAFYRIFENKWPEHYFSPDDKTSIFISVSFMRYIAFRFLPTLLIVAICLSILRELQALDRMELGVIIGLGHGLITNGVSLLKILLKKKSVKLYINRFLQIGTNIFSILVVSVAGGFGGYLSSYSGIQKILPTFQGVVDNIWSSIFAISILLILKKFYLITQSIQPVDMYSRSLKKIHPGLLRCIKEESKKNNADEHLVLAVCVVENLQRPKWLRNIEKLYWSIFKKEGTYGIMQFSSGKYLTDRESISLAIQKFFKDTGSDYKDYEVIEKIAQLYNADPNYIAAVSDAYTYLKPYSGS